MVAVVKFSSSLAMMMSLGYVAYSALQIKTHQSVYEKDRVVVSFRKRPCVAMCILGFISR